MIYFHGIFRILNEDLYGTAEILTGVDFISWIGIRGESTQRSNTRKARLGRFFFVAIASFTTAFFGKLFNGRQKLSDCAMLSNFISSFELYTY